MDVTTKEPGRVLPGHHLPGAGLETVWPQFLAVAAIGLAFFAFSIGQFRKSIAVTK